MANQKMEDTHMSDGDGAPVNQSNSTLNAGQTMELTFRSGRTTTLENTPPSAPTQASFPGIFSLTDPPGTNAPSNSQASASTTPTTTAGASTTATRPTAPAAQATTGRPLAKYGNKNPWHTWGRLAEIMRQNPDEPARSFTEIRKRSVPVMRKRRQAISKRAIRRKESGSRQKLKNQARNQVRANALANDPVYKRMTEVMGQPGGDSHTAPVKHVEDQLLKLGKGDAVTYRCCHCGKAGRQKQSIKGKEVEGKGGARCQCGHQLCMFCLHVETEEDELIDFEFMGLGDDEGDDEEGGEDGGDDGGGMGGAGVTLEVAA
ncbi:hypothetical protein BFW01_g609 [Lasiodiplodia theobromae]|uniref:Uncharacterized protein n=1 Tax=Lasiodiplodia theobromae TaxID=45133 RepID=A0A5N5D1B7_9PEZI|nr:uncharacterized protein LTHEOB_6384 [Lasiodiplodia theobromae]KAB2571377.1 hypothetical protein DBV05_g9954 [Lasiodiplodia theobromae]KAF4544266.1 hypothetical protein LTHEOB_6384 [Lasiodiplodia theobromae]KAF9641249.1 hypothetical protein BFW01_g609 [Lasiodiplodia theobromae]